MNLTDPETLTKLGKLILTDLVLAGDNALVIALATRSLGPREQFWGRTIGAGGAVGLRVLFVAIIAWLLSVPFVQLVGGIVLLWIAWKLIRPQEAAVHSAALPEGDSTGTHATPGNEAHEKVKATSLGQAVWIIIMADITMSFDNVVAISNIAGDSMSLVIFGLLLSIPLVVWGSVLISKLMDRYRWIIWLGGAVLGHVGGEIIMKDHRVLSWFGLKGPAGVENPTHNQMMEGAGAFANYLVHGLPWVFAVLLFIAGWLFARNSAAAAKSDKSHA